MGIPGKRGRATGSGFTLIELVLTIALILLLVGASVLNFGSLQRGAQLDEGVGQMEFLFRLARATAAGTGRQVRVSFAGDPGPGGTNAVQGLPAMEGIQVTWEPDPLGAPGRFHPLPEATPLAERLNDLIQCRATPAIPAMNESGAGSLSAGLPPAGSAGEPSAGLLHPALAEAIARTAGTRTLFVPRRVPGFVDAATGAVALRQVLIPVDREPHPQRAIDVAAGLIRSLGSAQGALTVLHVGAEGDLPQWTPPELPGWSVESVSVAGEVVDTILEVSDERDADLIVMGTRGHHGFLDALRGSTTERVLRGAECPVLTVPAG